MQLLIQPLMPALVRLQAGKTELAAEYAKLQAEHETMAADMDALKQQVSKLEGQRDELQTGTAQNIAELTRLCEVPSPKVLMLRRLDVQSGWIRFAPCTA